MKTLILNGGRPARLSLDGPSLLLAGAETAPRRFPFARVGRLLVGGQVACDAAALAACLGQGIPITFLRGGGAPAGIALPFSSENSRIDRLLEDFVALPKWRPLYADWKRSAERREILDVLRRVAVRLADLRPATATVALSLDLSRRFPGSPVEHWRTMASALLSARIAVRLSQGRIGGLIAVVGRMGLSLIADFAAILGWRFYADCRNWLETQPGILDGRWQPRLAGLVEAQAGRDDARIQSLWDRFCFWLAGMV